MNTQEVFDKIARHLAEQGRCARNGGGCMYRVTHGGVVLRCAVGALIGDEQYDEWEQKLVPKGEILEGKTVDGLIDVLADIGVSLFDACGIGQRGQRDQPGWQPMHDLLVDLQKVHDTTSTVASNEKHDRSLAEDYPFVFEWYQPDNVLHSPRVRVRPMAERLRLTAERHGLDAGVLAGLSFPDNWE